jgi:hypothetical protein
VDRQEVLQNGLHQFTVARRIVHDQYSAPPA